MLGIRDLTKSGARFISGFLHPDFTTRWCNISTGLVENLTMTLTATGVGC